MLPLLLKFIKHTQSNRRRKKNGEYIKSSTKTTYKTLYNVLERYMNDSNSQLLIYEVGRANQMERNKVKKYWVNFYNSFKDHLYNKMYVTDNYVGHNIKLLKVFLNWVSLETNINIGNYHKLFYAPKENIPIIVLDPEMLNFLIYDLEFETSLDSTLKTTKDLFVFGCTVGLRFSDLKNLKSPNLEKMNNRQYLVNSSKKTQTFTRVLLPQYAIDILAKHKPTRNKRLLPYPSLTDLNQNIKLLAEKAGWTQIVPKIRMRRGVPIEMKTTNRKSYRFCDLLSSHCMRRTAVTTLLRLGLEENLVRKISGHAPGSTEFYKYVQISQSFMDEELEKIHAKFSSKTVYLSKNTDIEID